MQPSNRVSTICRMWKVQRDLAFEIYEFIPTDEEENNRYEITQQEHKDEIEKIISMLHKFIPRKFIPLRG